MLSSIFWDVATSRLALGADGAVILLAAAIGWLPLVRYLPVIGPYVPTGRLVAVMVALVMVFMLGFRVADEREAAEALRVELALKQRDLEAAEHSAADANERATDIEGKADAQHKFDADYIAKLQADAACGFDPGPAAPGGLREPRKPFAFRFHF